MTSYDAITIITDIVGITLKFDIHKTGLTDWFALIIVNLMDWIFIWVYENVIDRISYFKNLEKVCSHGKEETCFKMRKNSLVFFLRNFFSI